MKKLIKYIANSTMLIVLFSGCSLIDKPSTEQDFELKSDHFQIVNGEQIPLTRNRNLINVQFAPNQDIGSINQLVEKYNLSFVNPNVDITEFNYRTILKVKDKPAEEYYTLYASTETGRFGNESGVTFALPIYELPDGNKKSLINQILVSFDPSKSQQRVDQILDSLKTFDHLVHIDKEWLGDLFLLQVDKESSMSPLDLSNHYETLDIIKNSSPNFGYSINRH